MSEDIINILAEHVIMKFGEKNAREYAESLKVCPCDVAEWYCGTCGFYDYYNKCCPGMRDWIRTILEFGSYIFQLIKDRILELLKK